MILRQTVLFCGLALAALLSPAQPDFLLHATPVAPSAGDPVINHALTTIQPQRIQQTIETLARFGTRSSLSSMETDLPAGQGINAAAEWIAAQFEQISQECGGCLEVHRDTF